ncbi:MAG TPA: carboxymuconolactone decarboxylase family protein [Thermoleophilaceae bacterium]|jgi:alkylhydroperoxidase family enzyme
MTIAATQARIQPVEPPYEPEIDRYLNQLMPPDSGLEPLKIFRTLVVNYDLATRMRPLSAGLLAHGTIEPRERELVILRTTVLNGAEYEWGVHATFFNELTPEEIRDTALQAPGWTGSDALLIRLCDELHMSSEISDELWEGLRANWSDEQLLELIILTGWYRTISYVINGLRIEPESWAARLP